MDYDNDDSQDHSHWLSGEKSSKPPPVLCPYDLPKFDFDDNLQTQLDFDPLVENEVFLGISTQEDNQWIEDISQDSGAIEFTSSATESCSISRRNNVWFEATSLESVEMLLKAVGQEDSVLGEAAIEESYSENQTGSLVKEMEPILKQDDEVDDNILTQSVSQIDIVTDGSEGSALTDNPSVVYTSDAQRDNPPYCGISGEKELNLAGMVIVTEENLEPDRKCDDADGREAENSILKSPTDNTMELSSVSGVHLGIVNVENAGSVTHNVIFNSGEKESNLAGMVIVNEENLEPDRKCDDADGREAENSILQSPTDNTMEPSSVSGVHLGTVNVENAGSVTHNVISNSGEKESNLAGMVIVNEENLEPDRKCDDADGREAENSILQSPTDNTMEPSSVSGVHLGIVNVENAGSVTHNVISNSGEKESNLAGMVIVNEENLEPDRKCDDADGRDAENSILQSPTDNTMEPSSVSGVHLGIVNVENAGSVTHNVISNSGEMIDQENRDQVTDISAESVDALLADNSEGVVEHNGQSTESTIVDEILNGSTGKTSADRGEYPHCVYTMVESLIESKVEVYTTTSQEPLELPTKVDSHLRKEYVDDITSKQSSQHCKYVVCSEGREPLHEDSPAVCQGDRSHDEKAIEAKDTEPVPLATPELKVGCVEDSKCLGNQVVSLEGQNIVICSNEVDTSSCPEIEMDSEAGKDKFLENNHQRNTNVSLAASVFVDDASGKQDVGSAEVLDGLSSLTSTCSSAELLMGRSVKTNLIPEGCRLPYTLGESEKSIEKDIDYQEVAKCKASSGTQEQAEEVSFNEPAEPEVGVNSVDDDRTYAAETEGREDTDLSSLKESLELATGLKPVNEYDKASQGDQEATDAGTECSEKLELCSASVILIKKPVDVTAAAESDDNNNIPLREPGVFEPAAMEIHDKAALVEASEAMSVSVAEPCLDQRRNDHEAIVSSETQITEQIGPSTKDGGQASVDIACPSTYGYDGMNEDGRYPVHLLEDNCEGRKLEIKETANDSFQHTKSLDADGTTTSVPLPPENETTRESSSFTFDVRPSIASYEGKYGGGCLSFPSIQVDQVHTEIKGSPLAPISTQMVPEVSRETPQAPLVIGEKAHVGDKVTPERKTKRASGKATVRSAKKGNNVMEVISGIQSDEVNKSPVPIYTPRTGQPSQFRELKTCSDVARSGTKPVALLPIPPSNLPDLNTSVPTASYIQQPFTDLQQVQLRAQIFVYGSLIQESAPDEACMISAFDQPGGGNVWGPAWRACVERVQSRKSHSSNMGTPIPSGAGGRASGQLAKHSALQNKILPSTSGRSISKSIPSPAVSPIIPLSSPLWNVSTPSDGLQSSGMPSHQPLNPLNSYQVPGTRNFVGHTPLWPTQSPLSSMWTASPQTPASDATARFFLLPSTEPVKPIPVIDSSLPSFPGMNIAVLPYVPCDSSGTSISTGTSQHDISKAAAIPRSADSKPRKRKKVLASEGSGQIQLLSSNQGASVWPPGVNNQFFPVPETVSQKLLLPQCRTESAQTAAASSLFSTSIAVTAPDRSKSASSPSKFPAAVSPMFSGNQLNRMNQNPGMSVVPGETSSTVEEAKLHAETAAAHAAKAFSHYHDIWNQLTKQKDSGVITDVEAELASSAVAITAATSVARAAAAAAMVASNVAVQAKLMADEVTFSSAVMDPTPSNSLSNTSSSAILKRGDGSVSSSSIIAVAREAAKKRVEAASAASKHAENLDAIVEAAELAAEAVSQAGKILSVGGSLPLSELKELAPVGSEWSADKHTADCDQPKAFTIELFNFSAEEPNGGPSGVESKKAGKFPSLKKGSFRAQRGGRASELEKSTGFVPEEEAELRSFSSISDDACANAVGPSIESGMKEGCLVEVFKDCGNYKAAWYSATILELKDRRAYLCYTDLQAEEGIGNLKEWVPLQGDYISMPTIRLAHPTTNMRFDGTSRKRKAAVVDYSWLVGDRVDVWMQDCWREGVVKEKSKNDETMLIIDIPALGDTSVARAWHLRPTLTWQDGKWTEWSSPRLHSPSQGHVPQEKRMRLGSPVEAKGQEKNSLGVDLVESGKHKEPNLLPILENEKEFNIGKSTVKENKQRSRRTLRNGLQKEGSRVVFGVPEPGKKRKFMDVSKHSDSDQSRKNMNTDDSVKFARYMAPQVSGSRRWKNSAKIDFKEKQVAEEPKVFRSGKPPVASGRTQPRKVNNSAFTKSSRAATVTDRISDGAISSEEYNTCQDNLLEFESVSDSQDTSEVQTLVAPKKGSSSNDRIERHNKGKSVPFGGRMGKKNELQEKLVPEFVEQRRSYRTIQPTSRLLEGLQSSLSITKMPSSSRSHKNQSRSKF
ncbi:protein SWOLLEN 1-like isoform X2 [Apium graveolens]|uniref:protein SWOLLEN 1-like isoform X2 n=1 Tax=Apium graveolens TaxID=4045 RepID=UPI003D795C2C